MKDIKGNLILGGIGLAICIAIWASEAGEKEDNLY